MKIRNVHLRELPVPSEEVGALIDGLGGPADRLWPAERWPTTPLELDGPLASGTESRQGLFELTLMRQRVEEYEPGRRVVFRFAPGLGLAGTHRLEVERLGPDRARLVHTLDCRVALRMLPVYPILIRQHDALVEDLLDRAELAVTGGVAAPARWPASVRIANAIEVWVARRRGLLRPARGGDRHQGARLVPVFGLAVPAVLAGIAALHAAWALGWYWPAGSEQELAEHVLSNGERERLDGELPSPAITGVVALGLGGAAAVVRAAAGGTRSRALRGAAWGVAGIFLVRGLVYPPLDVIGGLDDTDDRLDLAIYSPLCLALGLGTTLVLRGTAPARAGRATPAGTAAVRAV
jgi:hypothetical protein